jgi:hypothetical protein
MNDRQVGMTKQIRNRNAEAEARELTGTIWSFDGHSGFVIRHYPRSLVTFPSDEEL